MLTKLHILFATLVPAGFCVAQILPSGIRDTTFSLKSAYRHEIARHPEIQFPDSTTPRSVQVRRNIIYASRGEGRNLFLDIYQKKQAKRKKLPAVLLVHGGGWRSGDRFHNHTLAGKLAAEGLVTITADYRLSTEALFPAAVLDLKEAVRWIRSHAANYGIDTAKIAILGFSAGGELAAFIGTTNKDRRYDGMGGNLLVSSTVQAVIDIDGTLAFIHPESGEGDDSKSISAATYWFGYSKAEKPELWIEAAPLTHVTRKTPPFLFINSSVGRMHAGREDFIAKLSAYGIYSKVVSFPDAPHTFMFFDPWFSPTLAAIDEFLKKVFR